MNAGVLVKLADAGACTPGCKFVTWPWSVAFAAAKAASWVIRLIIGSVAAAMFAACCPLVLTMVDVKAVNSTRESQRLCSASGRLFGRELTAALVASGRLFGRESTAALKWLALRKKSVTTTWVRGVVDPLGESRQRLLSTNPTGADTLRPSSMLNWICRLNLDVSRTGTILKAAFIGAEEACDILADISDP